PHFRLLRPFHRLERCSFALPRIFASKEQARRTRDLLVTPGSPLPSSRGVLHRNRKGFSTTDLSLRLLAPTHSCGPVVNGLDQKRRVGATANAEATSMAAPRSTGKGTPSAPTTRSSGWKKPTGP